MDTPPSTTGETVKPVPQTPVAPRPDDDATGMYLDARVLPGGEVIGRDDPRFHDPAPTPMPQPTRVDPRVQKALLKKAILARLQSKGLI
jgi:hypothetical protein